MNIIEATEILKQGGTVCKAGNPDVKIKCTEINGEVIVYSEGGEVTSDIVGILSTDYISVEE